VRIDRDQLSSVTSLKYAPRSGALAVGCSSDTWTSRPGSAYGSGFSSTLQTIEKIAVFAPMPRASVRQAAAVKPFCRIIQRSVCRTSLQSVSMRHPISKKRCPEWDSVKLLSASTNR